MRFILVDALAEAAEEGEHFATALHGLEGEVLALAPRIGRRRSIHCHGRIAADRRLLLARAVVDETRTWGRDGACWYTLWLVASYAVSDYDRDHFVMLGPRVEGRV